MKSSTYVNNSIQEATSTNQVQPQTIIKGSGAEAAPARLNHASTFQSQVRVAVELGAHQLIEKVKAAFVSAPTTKLNSSSLLAAPSPSPTQTAVHSLNHTSMEKHSSWLLAVPKMDTFVDIFSLTCSTAVIFGGLVPYVPQYLKIKRSRNSDGFSTYVCLTLLLANILRIMFWFGHQFETPLLIQSFVMIIGMMFMMELCIRVRNKVTPTFTISGRSRHLRENEPMSTGRLDNQARPSKFWDWDDYLSYARFILLFTIILGSATYLMKSNYYFTEGLGCVAVFTESMLGIPQLLRNLRKKSTEGMSVEMVAMWLSGDLFKTLYFIIKHTPAQFYVCGAVQVTVDILILCQVLWYRRPTAAYRKLAQASSQS